MINIYVDSNIIPGLKKGEYPPLSTLMKSPQQYSFIYSTSHINDLLVGDDGSQRNKDLINSDLEFISKLTNNRCAELLYSEVIISERDPIELYEDALEERFEFDTDDFCGLMLKDHEEGSFEYEKLTQYLRSAIPKETKNILKRRDTAAAILKHYPGLTVNSTMGDLLNIGWMQYRKFMQADEYKKHRDDLQQQLKLRPNQFSAKEPFQAIDAVYQEMFDKMGNTFQLPRIPDKNAPKWYNDIIDSYLKLDMHGYYQDKIKVDAKNRATMRNMIHDGFHAAFASLCDYYITNDSKTIEKTRAVYNKLEIQTIVFNPREFEVHYNENLISRWPSRWINKIKAWLHI